MQDLRVAFCLTKRVHGSLQNSNSNKLYSRHAPVLRVSTTCAAPNGTFIALASRLLHFVELHPREFIVLPSSDFLKWWTQWILYTSLFCSSSSFHPRPRDCELVDSLRSLVSLARVMIYPRLNADFQYHPVDPDDLRRSTRPWPIGFQLIVKLNFISEAARPIEDILSSLFARETRRAGGWFAKRDWLEAGCIVKIFARSPHLRAWKSRFDVIDANERTLLSFN